MFDPEPYLTDTETKIAIPAKLMPFFRRRLEDFRIPYEILGLFQLPDADTEELPSQETVDDAADRLYHGMGFPAHDGALLISRLSMDGVRGLVNDREQQRIFDDEIEDIKRRGAEDMNREFKECGDDEWNDDSVTRTYRIHDDDPFLRHIAL